MRKNFAIALVVLGVLAGCATSKEGYEAVQVALDGSPKLRANFIADCTKRSRGWPAAHRQTIAALMNVSENSAESVFCKRMTNAVARNRLTYDDYLDGMRNRPNANIIKVLQGR